jgi:hypothetical protein
MSGAKATPDVNSKNKRSTYKDSRRTEVMLYIVSHVSRNSLDKRDIFLPSQISGTQTCNAYLDMISTYDQLIKIATT